MFSPVYIVQGKLHITKHILWKKKKNRTNISSKDTIKQLPFKITA